ncbi:hypothetical protein K491DRAFT_695397 [Lophiostoma macrostomum CBS 122681]|uniref:Phosphoglycerate mutase-like protein n=1 Tax=Lophiostoma macrostomum CBS 122681 TaxID=1314788 RepID=A0A6A6SYN4_9PLEO|nr:hypothetical protein K491DRAFT_695397 [Lophiostoma macrostomum CBS 122681]
MAKGPAVVVIARHGARLDAADQTWHLTSPTPYDPPLTYGGWTQSKALGLRIASLLHEREKESKDGIKANGTNADLAHLDFSSLDGPRTQKRTQADGLPKPKRRHKFVIHSSPYLRCIQTSTAIAAGISQFQPPSASSLNVSQPTKTKAGIHGHSPLPRPSNSHSPAVQPIPVLEPAADPNLEVFPKKHVGPDKILLRVDAFLGEWLCPDYYEDITPPPNSTMMVAGAKADLLRRGEYIEVQHHQHNSVGHFPGGWVKSGTPSAAPTRKNTHDGPFSSLAGLGHSLRRERSNSQGSVDSHTSRTSHRGASITTAHKVPDHIYDPPVPSYAVSPADPIPRGYTAHARDACIDPDFQWDSSRAPQEWGDGGEYGDEWSTMHKRFRRGLGGMMTWYKEHGADVPKDQFPGFLYRPSLSVVHHKTDPGPHGIPEVEDDEDLVLILVTHGAGCNALLGAISNQPVLLDVGMASLSMAVRRDEPRKPSMSSLPIVRRPSVVNVGMSNEYEMKLLASTDHLRPGVDPSTPLQPQSPAVVASPSLEYRRKFRSSTNGANSPIESPITLGQPWQPINSSLGSMRRSSTSRSSSGYTSQPSHGSVSPSIGLWSSLKPPASSQDLINGRHSPGQDMVLSFRQHQPPPTSNGDISRSNTDNSIVNGNLTAMDLTNGNKNAQGCEKREEHDDVPPLRSGMGISRSSSQHGLWNPKPRTSSFGLWGPPKLDDVSEREPGPKRRWTITDTD